MSSFFAMKLPEETTAIISNDKKYDSTFRCCSSSSGRRSGRITIIFGWCITVVALVVLGSETVAAIPQQWPSSDVEVFGSAKDGIRSQSISYVESERYPRQLDTVHDHLRGGRSAAAKLPFDSDYDRFIKEHFRQNYQQYRPEAESDQMARDHERFQELPHYNGPSRPVKYTNAPRETAPEHRPRKLKNKLRRPTIHEDVEDYQPNEEAVSSFKSHSPSDDYQRIKQLSEQQAKEIQQNPEHCKTKQKNDMVCQMCYNPKTGAKSESCSYASKPHSKKYAYIKENNYSSKKDDDSAEEGSSEDTSDDSEEDEPEAHTRAPLRKRNQSKMVRRPRIKRGGSKTQGAESKKIETYDDFFASLFPEYQKYQKGNVDDGKDDEYEFIPRTGNHKKDVEKALAEFRKKDWSDCKNIHKGELTCYECEDEHGVHHEECMYISESSPKSSRLTYTEDEKYDSDNSEEGVKDEENVEDEAAASESVSIKDILRKDKAEVEQHSELVEKEGKNNSGNEDAAGGGAVVDKGVGNKKNNVKLNKKLVIKKRKLKQHLGDYTEGIEKDTSSEKSPVKRTIRKKVTYRKTAKKVNQGGGKDHEPSESRVMYYEQKVTHTS